MAREKTKWEKVVDAENAKVEASKISDIISVEALLDAYEKEWNRLPWLVKFLSGKKTFGRLCYLAGSVKGMEQLIEATILHHKRQEKK